MAVHLRLGGAEVLGLRFARSPLAETIGAVRTLREPRRQAFHLPWLRAVDRAPVAGAVTLLAPLVPTRGTTPDLLIRVPAGPSASIDDELAAVAATPPEVLRADLRRCAAHPLTRPDVRAALLRTDVGSAQIAEALRTCWDELVAPFWPDIEDLLTADVAHRSAQAAAVGVGAVLGALHGDVTWGDVTWGEVTRAPDVLTVHRGHDGDHDLRGRGLVLMPAVFGWPMTIAVTEPTPVVIYPARGVGTLSPIVVDGALTAVLGRSRARLLVLLDDEASGVALARRTGLGAPTTSVHLGLLRDAGLVSARRAGREVRYRRTPLGDALVTARGRSARPG